MFGLLARGTRDHRKARTKATDQASWTDEQRRAWAAEIRRPLVLHPKQKAAVSSKHRRVALAGNRRSGKTTGWGTEILARLIENDFHTTWVFVEHLDEFTENWLARGYSEYGDPAKSPQTGMRQQLELFGIPYKLHKYDDTRYYGFTFPWGSRMVVHPAGSIGAVQDARGGSPNDIWVDEAQKQEHITAILDDVGGPAAKDFRAQFILTGTPGEEIGSFFHQVISGQNADWEVHDVTSADNPRFGDTWVQRYNRSVLEDLIETRRTLNLSDYQIEQLEAMTEQRFVVSWLEAQEWVHTLPESVRRETLRLWVAPSIEMIYPQEHIPAEQRYWGDWAPAVTAAALGIDVKLADVLAQVEGWPERFKLLPRHERRGQSTARKWQAVICQDLGRNPDAMAITLQVWANHQPLFEFDTAKIRGLRGDEMLDILGAWIDAARALPNVTLWGVVVDDDGGATPAMVDDWRHKLVGVLPTTGILDAYKPKQGMQVMMLNTERARGHVRILRNGPIDVEEQHLRLEAWDPERPGKKRDRDKHRQVNIAVTDAAGRTYTLKCAPGDDALDARRYGWWRATRLLGTLEKPGDRPPRMTDAEWQEVQLDRRWKRGRRRAS